MAMKPGKTALVTGALGFTGRYVCQALRDKGLQVYGLAHQPSDEAGIVETDLRDVDRVSQVVADIQPDYVVHLAAISYVGAGDAEAFYAVNTVGTCNLLEALERCSPEKVLVASSANIYGQPADGAPIDETRVPAPVNHYAASKLAMEHMVRTWFDRLPIIITRPFNYTGPGQDSRFLVPKIVDHFRQGKERVELGNIDVSRDFSDVRDLVKSYIALLGAEVNSETVNICSGCAVSLKSIVSTLEEIAGYRIDVFQNPDFMRANEIKTLVGSNEKLKKLIGFVPAGGMRGVLEDMYRASPEV